MKPRENRRRSIRKPGFDYRDDGTYFVTMCTHDREHLFGEIRNGMMGLNDWGCVVADCIEQIPHHFPGVTVGTFVVMPNHVHLLMYLGDSQSWNGRGTACRAPTSSTIDGSTGSFGKPQSRSLSTIISALKSACTKRINALRDSPDTTVWQRNFHEHIVRDEQERERIERYIMENPSKWTSDEFAP